MKPISLSVKNLASYKEETLNYNDLPDLTCITGRNGAGKSSFFVDAITIALFNQARCTDSKGTGMENLITTGEDKLEVKFRFESDGSEVEITRRRFTKGGQELELTIDGVSHTDKIKETQEKINNIIKVDYETFLDSVCIGQGDSGRFIKKKPEERKEEFKKVLGLDKYEVLQEYTKEVRKVVNEQIKRKKEQLEEVAEIVSEKSTLETTIEQEKLREKNLVNKIEKKQFDLEREISEKTKYDEAKKQRDYVLNKKKGLVEKIKSIKESVEKGKTIKKTLEITILSKSQVLGDLIEENNILSELQQELTDLKSDKSSLQTKNNMLSDITKELKEKYSRLKDFNEADCDFCGQQVTEQHKSKHLSDLATQGKIHLSEINSNKEKIDNLNQQVVKKESSISFSKNKISRLQTQKSDIEQAEVKLGSVIQRLHDLSDDLIEREGELEEVSKLPVEDIEDKTFNDTVIRNEINTLNQQLTFCRNSIAIAKSKIKEIDEKQDEYKDLEEETKKLTEESSILDELVVAFGKDGIQAIIIDNALPEIQEEINKFLGLLTDDRVNIEFITQKEKGRGKKTRSIETLDIVINDEYGSRTYETYSGGEKFRVDFSCHVGLAKFLAKRAGSSIRLFIVDEGIGSQDEVQKSNL